MIPKPPVPVAWSVLISPDMKNLLDHLAYETTLPIEEILRRAIALYKTCIDATKEDLTPALVDLDYHVSVLIKGLW